MVLADTSVWIRAPAGQSPNVAEMDRLLSIGQVAGHELVYGELLIGDNGGRKKTLDAFEQMHQARTMPHEEVVAFVRQWRLHGRGAGWIDVHLLTSAVIEHFGFWTADVRLSSIAEEFGIAHQPHISTPAARGSKADR
jgi:predicted nucleic acid-binding protein